MQSDEDGVSRAIVPPPWAGLSCRLSRARANTEKRARANDFRWMQYVPFDRNTRQQSKSKPHPSFSWTDKQDTPHQEQHILR